MNKKKFNDFIKNIDSISVEDMSDLKKLQTDHPYSQVIHALSAKVHIYNKTKEAQNLLGYAAIYSTDRGVLKSFIQDKGVEGKKDFGSSQKTKGSGYKDQVSSQKNQVSSQKNQVSSSKSQVSSQKTENKDVEFEKKIPTSSGVDEMELLRQEVMANLAELTKTKVEVDRTIPDEEPEEKKKTSKTTQKKTTEKKAKPKATKTKANISEKKKATTKPKKATATKAKTVAKSSAKKEVKKKTKKVTESTTPKSSEFSSDSPIETNGMVDKKTEQIQLIDNFIKNQPKVSNPDEVKPNPDLETIDLARESVSFKDDLVSENLAIIFSSQGKVSKAIDIYKKLIWKYPQKKAYFAAQIEILENK